MITNKRTKEHIIYDTDWIYEDEYQKEAIEMMREAYDEDDEWEPTQDELWQYLYDELEFNLDADKCNLNKELNGYVVALADVGLWYGRRTGYKILDTNLNCILDNVGKGDSMEVYTDEKGNVRGRYADHDGATYVLFRLIEGSKERAESILEKCNCEYDLIKRSKPLYPHIAKVFGWR